MRWLLLVFLLSLLSFASCEKRINTEKKTALKDWTFYYKNANTPEQVSIPHTWNANDAFDDEKGYWRGMCAYERRVDVQNKKKFYYLHFEGSNQLTTLWVNNKKVGVHEGGYSAFDFSISDYVKIGENKLRVEVDNSHADTIPPLDADFTFYGGIYRSVYLLEENEIHIKREYGADKVRINALPNLNSENGNLIADGELSNLQQKTVLVELLIRDDAGNVIHKEAQKIKNAFHFDVLISKPKLWSPNAPNLYNVEIVVSRNKQELDRYSHKIGFRIIEAKATGFKINGKPLKLIGANRHQDWEDYGNAVPTEMQVEEMRKIKEMGANFVRLAHYPQCKEVYAAADELGLILWSETPIVNKVPIGDLYEPYEQICFQMQQEHIAQNYNHPSLVFIGYMNEIFIRLVFDKPDNPEEIKRKTIELTRRLEELTRKKAPHHITATAFHQNDLYNEYGLGDIPMVVGWNLYLGWYGGKIYDLGEYLDKQNEAYPNRPLIISEYGVGADVRLHSEFPEKYDFTEEYQLRYHQGYVEQVKDRDFVIGMAVWNYADFGSEFRGDTKPHINQKGLVNYDRTPKNIYYWYQAILKPNEPIAKFYVNTPNFVSDEPRKELKIITNQDVVLSQGNTKLMKLAANDSGVVDFDVELKEGTNEFVLRFTEDGDIVDSYIVNWHKPDFNSIDTLRINFGSSAFYTDEEGDTWSPAHAVQSVVTCGNPKMMKSATNILNTADDLIYQTRTRGITKISTQLPKGRYKVELILTNLKKEESSIYELNKQAGNANAGVQSLKFYVNDKKIDVGNIEPSEFKTLEIVLDVNPKLEIKSSESSFSINALRIIKLK